MCAATLGAVMFLLNGFLLYRLTIGHVTFHTFAVAPLLAWTALHPHQTNGGRIEWSLARRAVLGGCLLAYVTYGGGPHLIIPVVLTVAATILLWQLVYSFDNRPWATLALACFWSLPVAAMKLAPAAVLAAEFPRPYLPAFLFKNPLVFLKSLGLAFLAPELLPDYVSMGPDRATLGRHEYEFGLSFVPAVLLGLTFWRVDLKRVMLKHYVSGMVLAVLLATPLALTFGPTWWGRMLLSVPVIRNNTTLVRWWLIYIIPTIVGSALSFDWLVRTPKTRTLGLVAAVFVIVGQSTLRDVEYYSIPDPPYDPVAALEADRIIRAGGTLPSIKRIGQTQEFFAQRNAFLTGSAGARRFFSQNDAFLTGTSAWPCYDGLFGYYLELLPDPGLRFGSALEASPDGTLNLINPASFFKRSGGRAAVTRFAIGELPRAKDFASYRPIEGAEPPWQVVATWTTRWSAGGSVLILGWMALAVLARASRGHCELRGRARRGRRMAPEDR
jgi:hypothetical protein